MEAIAVATAPARTMIGTVQKTERTGGEGRAGFRVYQPSVEPLN